MLARPEISDDTIIACLHDAFGLHISHVTFLPLGWVNNGGVPCRHRQWHTVLLAMDRYLDPIAASLAAFWLIMRYEIASFVERAEQLAHILQTRAVELTVCHSDLHAGNVLVGAGEQLTIVDWDEPILAPKERDLMFIGGGVGGTWNTGQEPSWFYQGYGQTEIDLLALCYYLYERIVVDIAEYAGRIFGLQGSVEERQDGLELMNQFLPNNVVDAAHRTYQLLAVRGSAVPFLHDRHGTSAMVFILFEP